MGELFVFSGRSQDSVKNKRKIQLEITSVPFFFNLGVDECNVTMGSTMINIENRL